MSAAKVALGRRLFYDADLSINGTMACATCHEQRHGFADGNRTRPGVHGDAGRRNVPGLANIGWIAPLTWADPGLATLEAQVAVPVLGDHPVEMGMRGAEAEIPRRFARDACYVRMFAAAFPDDAAPIDLPHVARALAAFQRSMIAYASPYDRYRRGAVRAMAPAAIRGEALFAARCAGCHAGANFTDGDFHAIDARSDPADPGLSEKSGRADDAGRFRTPSLRNVALTAPYFHDGASATLPDALQRHAAVPLADREQADLITFLMHLTDARFVNDPRLAMAAKACGRLL